MGRHPDLPNVKPYKLYVVIKGHTYKDVVIDHVEFDLELDCRYCGKRGPEHVIVAPNPWDGEKMRWYHVGCRGCQLHAFDIHINEKEAWALPYEGSYAIRASINNSETKTRIRH